MEKTYEINLEYDFKLSSQFSGKIKFGTKKRTKFRSFDQNNDDGVPDEANALCGMLNEFPEYFSEYIGLCGSSGLHPLGTDSLVHGAEGWIYCRDLHAYGVGTNGARDGYMWTTGRHTSAHPHDGD